MSRWAWLSTSLSEASGVFGEFNQCVAYQSGNQKLPQSPGQSSTLETELDVLTFMNEVTTTRPKMCILAFTNRAPENNGRLPLPISKKLFQQIVQVFDISATFLTALTTGLATYSSTVSPKSGESDKEERSYFVIQQNRAYSACSIGLTYSIQSGQTRILLFGVESWFLSQLFEYLRSMSPLPCGPMVVPTIAMELQAQWFSRTIKRCQDGVHSIETATGMRQFNYPHEEPDELAKDWKYLDLISITRELSGFLSRFAFIKLQADTGEYLLEQMAKTTLSLMHEAHQHQSAFYDDQRDIIHKIEEHQSLYKGIAARCRYLTERATAQSQTVYCLVATKDNMINIDIAQASRRIAEASRKDNEAMRAVADLGRKDSQLMIQVAKDSRSVAIATARDSAAMQVIAAVTVLFLPATFIATFFSMTFFDFLDAERPRVSPWTWLYFLITAVLTIAIQLAWAVLSKRKSARIIRGISVDL
ncbi:hypothetical protein BKA67DRAFT_318626 [Truncatella angustata]|uniref:Uncharacterized protein n=1 Tax=Truncatella angustata TaxID=152316 RepID=A0A9P8UJL7_9PEZI|nr:uncharacterized protein BKA67DRAFT_318626 [Truncatella angustata]KAH6653381.1 hypothetical protein BKA67DRAFT_318626 [Truncatella angustata]